MRTYWICDTRSGAKLAQVMPSAGSFKRVLCGSGSGEHTFRLGFGKRTREQWRALTQPWARTLAIDEDGVVIYAGIIAKRPYKWKVWQIKVTHVDVREIFRRRFPFGVKSYWENLNTLPGKLVLTNLSQRAVVARILQESLVGPFPTYSLPIVLPSATEAGSVTVTYENYLLRTTFDLLEDIQNMDRGPDIDFVPRWSTSNTLEWVAEVGTPSVPHLTKGSIDFNLTVRDPKLFDVTYDEDATDQLTGIFSVGTGSEVDMAVGGDGMGYSATTPALDVVQRNKAEANPDILASFSRAGLTTLAHPTVQIGVSMNSVAERNLATMPVGTMLRINFKDDPWIPDGWKETRAISYSGDMSKKVSFETQPLVGA
ncbi:hypothetical protein [Cryobacterium soli]|uniref:hypothetical protein n=1 Tax=Cryobacterium soli TaxID=2220095 RepID=UPI000E74F086|nr:hypothetical protein [Cryobacterium soli]